MKSKRGIAIVLVLFAAILLWSLWPRADGTRTSASDVNSALPEQGESKTSASALPPDQPESTITYYPPGSAHDPAAENYRRQQEAIERSLDEWRTPIAFYGKAVDETMQPVAGVAVTFGVTDLSPEGHSTHGTESGTDGLFFLQGVNGKHLSIKLYKPGYYVSRGNPAGLFYAGRNDNFVADASQPVLFHLRKHGQAEPLIRFHKSFVVPKDGVPILVDLATGNLTTASGTAFQVECRTQAPASRGAKYDWECRVSVPGGGLQITDEEFPFEAPAEGYVDSELIDMTVATAERWQRNAERKYFIQTADGRFGRLIFRMIAGGDHFCRIESYLNPSGSPNLEYNEAAQALLDP